MRLNSLRRSSFGLVHHQNHHLNNGESSSANLTGNISSSDDVTNPTKLTHDNRPFMNGHSSSVCSDQTVPYSSLIRKSTIINDKNGNHVSYYFNEMENGNSANDDDEEIGCASSPNQYSNDHDENKKECHFFVD